MALLEGAEKTEGAGRLSPSTVVGRWVRVITDVVFPPLCLGCRGEVDLQGHLCPACWAKLQFIDGSQCEICGLPFEADLGPGVTCAACAAAAPAFAAARAVLRYDDASRPLILAFKHGDRLDAAPAFANWLARVARPLAAEADVIAPVPLHRWRLWTRRYNQAAALATALAPRLELPCRPDLLVRARATPSQGGLTRSERQRNVRGAFRVANRDLATLKGRSVLLVDDVMTTGATVDACAKALIRAGARRVTVLALARVV